MGTECFSVEPSSADDAGHGRIASMPARLRQIHRWTSIVFTLTVAATFVMMIRGPVSALITYSPLPPLLVLAVTGLYMFARYAPGKRRGVLLARRG